MDVNERETPILRNKPRESGEQKCGRKCPRPVAFGPLTPARARTPYSKKPQKSPNLIRPTASFHWRNKASDTPPPRPERHRCRPNRKAATAPNAPAFVPQNSGTPSDYERPQTEISSLSTPPAESCRSAPPQRRTSARTRQKTSALRKLRAEQCEVPASQWFSSPASADLERPTRKRSRYQTKPRPLSAHRQSRS
jgi:hypothetical protein